MANKFIVFVVFAAVARASSALSAEESSGLKTAEEGTRSKWYAVGDTVCKSVQDKSWSIKDAEEQFSSDQAAGAKSFMNVAPLSGNQSLQEEIASLFKALPEAVFKGIKEARECSNYSTTKAQLENYKKQIPYERLVEAFHKTTEHTGSWTPAVDALKSIYVTFFNEIQELALSVCGGGKSANTCASEEIRKEIDALVKVLYSWLVKTD